MVLRRIDVARNPTHLGAKGFEGLDQNGGLDRHVERATDARAFEGLRRAELFARGHQARHFGFGNRDFLVAVFSQFDVGDMIVVSHINIPLYVYA